MSDTQPTEEQAVSRWMQENGFELDTDLPPAWYRQDLGYMPMEQATFFYRLMNKQVTAALEAVKTKVIGKNEIPQWDEESSFCDRCEFERTDDSKDCLCRIRNKLRAKQRIVLKTLQLAALTQGGHDGTVKP